MAKEKVKPKSIIKSKVSVPAQRPKSITKPKVSVPEKKEVKVEKKKVPNLALSQKIQTYEGWKRDMMKAHKQK